MQPVLLLLCRGFEVYEAAAFHDVLGWSGAEGGPEVPVVTVGREPEVRGTFGLAVKPDRLLADVDSADYSALAVPGGFEDHGYYKDAYSEPVAALIRSFAAAEKPVASICIGALPVANSGVLRGRRATTYHLGGGRRREQLAEFGAEVVDERVVRDGGIITSTSPETAVDVALALLADLTDAANAAMVRRAMGFGE